jgi:hypothetical protein
MAVRNAGTDRAASVLVRLGAVTATVGDIGQRRHRAAGCLESIAVHIPFNNSKTYTIPKKRARSRFTNQDRLSTKLPL